MHFPTLLTLLPALPLAFASTLPTLSPRQAAPVACLPGSTYCGWYLQENLFWNIVQRNALFTCQPGGTIVVEKSVCRVCEGPQAHCA
ncbi:hypothetical protein M7I_8267 [Glarea lozoyensis 74030]|uniref:Uncharacterized protein n=1 Tax=Glarea lozoyensis (strain ATCC 74030 / MF5533) TaxID=1104152 RepID=H0EZJ5_GLAL7|nr:hypothetical protein M7I_8267 [Glarea lozoyensis 74030]